MTRFPIAILALFIAQQSCRSQTIDASKAKADSAQKELLWYDIRELGLEGQGWTDTESPFDRFPARAKQKVRPAVWNLSRNSAGICARFVTDATRIHAHWTLHSDRLAMPHMPATGVSGVDLYARDGKGTFRWVACGFPKAKENKLVLVDGLPAGKREYMLYLPLYNGVSDVRLGLSAKAKLQKAPERKNKKPIVFYGTSITQGGCASRPGMVHTAILGRWLDRPVINLGFSGNGRMESEVAEFIAELDPAAIVIDCLPNIDSKQVTERTKPVVNILRQRHATVPVVLVEDRNYTNSWLLKGKRQRNKKSQEALKVQFDQLRTDDVNLHYLTAKDMLGSDDEGTVDSSHPTDLGFFRQAEHFLKILQPLLNRPAN